MGRSVSTPAYTRIVAYAALEDECDSDDFRWHIEDFQREMMRAFPSLSECDEWIGREDRAVLRNRFAYFGVSEYCGLVAMWVAERDSNRYEFDTNGLRDRWISQIQQKFCDVAKSCFGQALVKQGTFSNGEAFFQPANGEQKGGMGLGYSSKEGWL